VSHTCDVNPKCHICVISPFYYWVSQHQHKRRNWFLSFLYWKKNGIKLKYYYCLLKL